MHFRTWAIGIAALPAVLGGAPAQADVLLSARLSNFGYSLIDLDPDDGIAPALEVVHAPYGLTGDGRTGLVPRHAPVRLQGDGFSQHGQLGDVPTVYAGWDRPGFTVRAGLSGVLAGQGFNAFIAGRAQGSRAEPDRVSRVDVALGLGPQVERMVVRLTPMTRVLWSGELALSLENTLPRRGMRREAGSVTIGVAALAEPYDGVVESVSRGLSVEGFTRPQRLREAGAVAVGFSNLGDDFRLSGLQLSLTGSARAFDPVPESGTAGMLLGGLALVGGAAARARRRRDSGQGPQSAPAPQPLSGATP